MFAKNTPMKQQRGEPPHLWANLVNTCNHCITGGCLENHVIVFGVAK